MAQFSKLKAIPASFVSGDLYRDVAHNWRGFGYLYLALCVLLLEAIPMTWAAGYYADKFLFGTDADGRNLPRSVGFHIADQLPVMHLEAGRLTAEGPQPKSIFIQEGGQEPYLLAIIDTTGQVTSVRDVDARILVTATEIQAKKSNMEVRSFSIQDISNRLEIYKMLLDKQVVRGLIDQGMKWLEDNKSSLFLQLGGAGVIALLVIFFLWRMLLVLVLSIAGKIASSAMNTGLEYSQVLRLCSVAMTPVIAFTTLLLISGKPMPLVMMVIGLAYVIFAVRANRAA